MPDNKRTEIVKDFILPLYFLCYYAAMKQAGKLVLSIVLALLAGGIGSLATSSNIPTWYAGIEKPSFNPPNEVFGPVWTVLYILMGISLYLVWTANSKRPKQRAFLVYGLQLVLNTAWSLVFFGLQAPEAALAVIVGLLASIVLTMRLFWPFSRSAVYLLIPYLAWVSFATVLNAAICILN